MDILNCVLIDQNGGRGERAHISLYFKCNKYIFFLSYLVDNVAYIPISKGNKNMCPVCVYSNVFMTDIDNEMLRFACECNSLSIL